MIGSAQDVHKFLKTKKLCDEIHEYAMKGDKRYYRYQLDDDLSRKSVSFTPLDSDMAADDIKSSAIANCIVAFDGETMRRRNPGGDVCVLMSPPYDVKSDILFFHPKYLGLSYRIPPDVFRVQGLRSDVRLVDALEGGLCSMRDGLEDVDESQCVVLDWANKYGTTLWCDPAIGFAIRRSRQKYANSTMTKWSTHSSDFVVTVRGTWFPRHVVQQLCPGDDAPPELYNSPLLEYRYDVIELDVNDVPDELFEMKIPPGVTVYDCVSEPGREASAAQRARILRVAPDGSFVDPHFEAPPGKLRQDYRSWLWVLVAVNLVAGISGAIVWGLRGKRRR